MRCPDASTPDGGNQQKVADGTNGRYRIEGAEIVVMTVYTPKTGIIVVILGVIIFGEKR